MILNKLKILNFVYIFLIITLIIFPLLIYFNFDNLQDIENSSCLLQDKNFFQESNTYLIEKIEYSSISIFPEVQNIECLGKIIDFRYEKSNTITITRAINLKLNIFVLNFMIVLFFISPLFKNKFKKNYLKFHIFFYIYFLIYNYFIFYKFSSDLFQPYKFEPTYLIVLLFFINIKYFKDDVLGLISQFIFITLFGTKFLGVACIILYFYKKNSIEINLNKYKLLLYLPIFKLLITFVTSLSAKFNFIWILLIEKPHAGLARFYDFQWNLVSLICEKNINFSEIIYFSNSIRDCKSESYSPIYKYFSYNLNIYATYVISIGIIFVLISFIYLKIIKTNKDHNFLIMLFFISPPFNFLIYQGNFDLIAFVLINILLVLKVSHSNLLLLVIISGLMELHPLAFLLGIFFYNLFKLNYKKIFLILSSILFCFIVIWADETQLSVRNWNDTIGFSYYFAPNISFGLSTDHIFLSNKTLDPLILYPLFFFLLLIMLFVFSRNKYINELPGNLNNDIFVGFSAWFTLVVLYENFSYRLALFIVFFFYLYTKNHNKYFQLSIILSLFLTPNSLVEFKILNYAILLVNKISIYILFFFVLQKTIELLLTKNKNLNS